MRRTIMTSEGICFEKAHPLDLRSIWYLLHANSRMLSEERLLADLDRLYILHYRQRILGVLCGTYEQRKVIIHWVAVHPLYPEKSLREAMIREFTAVICREPGIPSAKSRFLEKWRKRDPSLWKKELISFN